MTASASTFDVAARAGVLRLGRRLDHGRIVLHEGDGRDRAGKGGAASARKHPRSTLLRRAAPRFDRTR